MHIQTHTHNYTHKYTRTHTHTHIHSRTHIHTHEFQGSGTCAQIVRILEYRNLLDFAEAHTNSPTALTRTHAHAHRHTNTPQHPNRYLVVLTLGLPIDF